MLVEQSYQIVKTFLDEKYEQYNRPDFIEDDPVSIPHLFQKEEDIEIAAFLTATISWGQRPMILKKARIMMELLEMDPYNFITGAGATDMKRFRKFVYRTFNSSDLVYFILAIQRILNEYDTLGGLFKKLHNSSEDTRQMLIAFHNEFFRFKKYGRILKHLSNPEKGSAAKRMNMMLRWLVRQDDRGVDFGIWDFIPKSDLYLPLDLHTGRISRKLGILKRRSNDWKAVEEVTGVLRQFDSEDPAKYDFALFGLGIIESF